MSAPPIQNAPARWTQEFQVHSYEVDFRRVATLESICRFFLEAAWNHAEALGFGFSHLAARGKLWVLSRLLLRVESYPAWGETIAVRTWPRAAKSIFAMRDFQLLGGSDEVRASGASAWLVLDAGTRRPQRVEKLLETITALPNERATEQDPEKLPSISEGQPGAPFRVRYSDVDVNSHGNSCRYVGWVMDNYPVEFHARHTVSEIEVNYLGETRVEDELAIERVEEGLVHRHCLARVTDNHEVCRTLVRWRELPACAGVSQPIIESVSRGGGS